MELLAAIHAMFAADVELPAKIPGGLHQDFNQNESADLPYSVAEDAGGTRQTSSTGDGPEDQLIRFWVFDDDSDRGFAAARKFANKINGVELNLLDGKFAYGNVTSPVRLVTEQELMKDVQQGFQISFEADFQT